MNVLFVSETRLSTTPFRDASTRHRCYTMAEALHAAGHLADVATLEQLQLVSLSRYDVVSVQQPKASRKLLAMLEQCKSQNIRTVADIDALEFDAQLADVSVDSQEGPGSLATQRQKFMLQSLALQHFDEVSVATEELAKARREVAPSQPVYVVPTALSEFWLNCHDHLSLQASKNKRIGYFPGNRGMSSEFSVAAKAIANYLKDSSERELYVVGPLAIAEADLPTDQVVRGAWVDHMDLPEALAQCHVNIAPHQSNRINFAQPHTSFIEAAAFGIPTISSPTAELNDHHVPGLLIAETQEQWQSSLESLADEEFYQHCQKALYNYVRAHCRAEDSGRILIERWNAETETIRNETTISLSAAS